MLVLVLLGDASSNIGPRGLPQCHNMLLMHQLNLASTREVPGRGRVSRLKELGRVGGWAGKHAGLGRGSH